MNNDKFEKYNFIADKLNIKVKGIEEVVKLFEEGATIPFIARYRKELTGSLDEVVIADIKKLYDELVDLEKRKNAVIKTLLDRNVLTEELRSKILNSGSLIELEDLYQPYKIKKRTRAAIAKEKGLESLAVKIFNQKYFDIDTEARKYLNNEVYSIEDVLSGARDIIAEWISENVSLKNRLRKLFRYEAIISSKVNKDKKLEGIKFEDYYDWNEKIKKIPGYRMLAILRGNSQGILSIKIRVIESSVSVILKNSLIKNNSAVSEQVLKAAEDSYKRLLFPSLEKEMLKELKEHSDDEAIDIFSKNLKELLLQSPLGKKNVMALDPGFRTGVKLVCLNNTGNLVHFDTIFPFNTKFDKLEQEKNKVIDYCRKFKIEAIGIGNGTAGRETEIFIRSLGVPDNIIITMVNESGASIYSASEVARKEFPNHDITVRGAVSIGRRLIDPLAELVKIDPKSIGVGQYQHDVNQKKLKEALYMTVESCVNSVGVEINSASKELLEYVSGIGSVAAANIIEYRKTKGLFSNRENLKKVKGIGNIAFQQAAGFIRVSNSLNILDNTAVHPESYLIVKKMAENLNCSISGLIENKSLRDRIDLQEYITVSAKLPTLIDIMNELEKPGRDPRESFEVFAFADGINKIEDLQIDMVLPGIVTNVTKFGAFVDIGVHQDGLVHISEMSDFYVSDPMKIVMVQDKIKVKVLAIDINKKRISLSMKE
ncbi:MAG: RNA-binding transcriptional accessory protein [bacterium]|nr:RNA-binding transcriptional accessory protein [bacterium]